LLVISPESYFLIVEGRISSENKSLNNNPSTIITALNTVRLMSDAAKVKFDMYMSYRPLISYDLGHRTAHGPHSS
jgi:hypothetical protein